MPAGVQCLKGKTMHFYWRVIEELKYLGEFVVFKDPNLLRCYKFWLKAHADAISLSTIVETRNSAAALNYKGISPSLN